MRVLYVALVLSAAAVASGAWKCYVCTTDLDSSCSDDYYSEGWNFGETGCGSRPKVGGCSKNTTNSTDAAGTTTFPGLCTLEPFREPYSCMTDHETECGSKYRGCSKKTTKSTDAAGNTTITVARTCGRTEATNKDCEDGKSEETGDTESETWSWSWSCSCDTELCNDRFEHKDRIEVVSGSSMAEPWECSQLPFSGAFIIAALAKYLL